MTERTAEQVKQAAGWLAASPHAIEGQVDRAADGTFTVVTEGAVAPLAIPKTQAAEVAALITMRDEARALIAAEAADLDDSPQLDQMRSQLADRWRDYVGKYGPINRVTLRPTGRTDPDTGETIQARITPAAVRALRSDPSAALLWGLEVFDEAAGTAEPAALLRQRVVVPRQPVRGVDNAFDGLSVVLDTMGAVDLDAISHLTGTDVDTVVAELGDAIYQLPGTDSWQTREYLSGNVRKKLHQARVADLETPGHWQRNIDALQTVMPADLQAGDLSPRIGAVWISAEDHQQFLRDTLDLPRVRVDHVPGVGRAVENGSWGVKATEEWGTPRLDAGSIFEHLARQRPIAIFDTDPDKKRIYNPVASAAAIEKGRLLQERCDPWVLSLLLAVMGLCCAPAIAAAAEAISHAVPEARRGDAMGWQGTFSTLGNAVAPPFVGFAIDHGGWQQGFWVAGMGGAVAVGIAAALLAFGRRRAARAVV
ncbi:MAG TPA: MFS transporter [Propioniciclava tarda]|nr:MFS transporter [Propioniciclava tarda]